MNIFAIAGLMFVSATTASWSESLDVDTGGWADQLRDLVTEIADDEISGLYEMIRDADETIAVSPSKPSPDSPLVRARGLAVHLMMNAADSHLDEINMNLRFATDSEAIQFLDRMRNSITKLLVVCESFPGVGG